MDNETFDALPDREQLAVVLELAGSMMGRETVKQNLAQMLPLLRDLVGHGAPEPKIAGDAPDPKDNFWGGVWQVYDLE